MFKKYILINKKTQNYLILKKIFYFFLFMLGFDFYRFIIIFFFNFLVF